MEPSSSLWLGWWAHADPVIRGVFLTLVIMSILSWAVILEKFWQMRRWHRLEQQAAGCIERGDLAGLEGLPADCPTARLRQAAARLLARRDVDETVITAPGWKPPPVISPTETVMVSEPSASATAVRGGPRSTTARPPRSTRPTRWCRYSVLPSCSAAGSYRQSAPRRRW